MHRCMCVCACMDIYVHVCVLNLFLQPQFFLDFHTFLCLILRIGLFHWTNRLLKMIPHKTQFLTPIAPTPPHSWVALNVSTSESLPEPCLHSFSSALPQILSHLPCHQASKATPPPSWTVIQAV